MDKDRKAAVSDKDICRVKEYLTQNEIARFLAVLSHNLENLVFEVESLLTSQSQPADGKGHGRPIGVYPLIFGSASIDQTLKGSPMRRLGVNHPAQELDNKGLT